MSADNLTAAELRQKLELRRDRREELTGEIQRRKRRRSGIIAWIERAVPRLRRKRRRERKVGPLDAVAWCRRQLGTTEHPPGSNWGEPVEDWIRFTGYTGPVPWCGCFAAFAVVKIGGAAIPAVQRLGYHGFIIDDARAGRNGLRAVPVEEARPGDLVAYDFAHIGVIVGRTEAGAVHTIEGNTSPASGGSQNNGGGVYERRRPIGDVAVIARPAYA